MKYLLEIDDAQADVLIHALEVFARLHMGQAHIAIDEISLYHDKRFRDGDKIKDEYFTWRDRLKEIANCMGKVFTGMSEIAAFGITSDQIPDMARVAWDIHQVVRHCVSWNRYPEGRTWSCHFDEPWKTSYEVELPKITVKETQGVTNVTKESHRTTTTKESHRTTTAKEEQPKTDSRNRSKKQRGRKSAG